MIPSPFTTLSLCTVVLSLQAVPSMADEWITATPRHVVSKNGQYLARIVPGESWGDTVGFAGSKKGAYARAEFYEKQPDRSFKLISDGSLLNPIAPVGLLLSNHGYLMTFDNWHNAGFGKVVSIYKPGGAPYVHTNWKRYILPSEWKKFLNRRHHGIGSPRIMGSFQKPMSRKFMPMIFVGAYSSSASHPALSNIWKGARMSLWKE